MRRLSTAPIGTDSYFPIKKGTLEFLQDSYTEVLQALCYSAIGDTYSSSKVYVLYGIEPSAGAGGSTDYSQGAIFYNGNIYISYAQNVPALTIGQVVIGSIATSQYTSYADPVTFASTTPTTHNVHDIIKLQLSAGTSGSGIADYSDFIYISGTTFAPTYSGTFIADLTSSIKYSRSGKQVTIKGKLNNSAPSLSSADDTIFTLPVGYRPTQYQIFTNFDVVGGHAVPISVSSAGVVKVMGTLVTYSTAGVYFNFSFNVD
jgi:hypothetical protein